MTPAERKKIERDRHKAGLALLKMWVPQAKLDEISAAIAAILEDETNDRTS